MNSAKSAAADSQFRVRCDQRVNKGHPEVGGEKMWEQFEVLAVKPRHDKREWHSWKKEDQLRWITSRIEKVTWDDATGRVQIRLRPRKESHA